MKLRNALYGGAFLLELVLFAFLFSKGYFFLLGAMTVLELLVAVLHGKQKNT